MRWCPNCKNEYGDWDVLCHDCKTALSDTPPQKEDASVLNPPGEAEYFNPVFLKSVSNEIEANILKSLLDSYGIPVIKKYGEAGTTLILYAGSTNFGVDLYVPEELLSEATDIINAQAELSDEEIQTGYTAEDDDSSATSGFNQSYKVAVVFVIVIVLFSLAISIIPGLFK